MSNTNIVKGFNAIASSLREFGYPEVTGKMVNEIYDAMVEGKREHDLPHGVIGLFVQTHILNYPLIFGIVDE